MMPNQPPLDPNEDLYRMLAQSGLIPEQIAQLAPQISQGLQMMQPQLAQGAHVGNTYVAASPWEHLANALRPVIGGLIAGRARDKQQELLKQQGEARTGAFHGLQTAISGGQGGTLGAPGGGTPYDQFAGATPNGGGPTRAPDPQTAQALMTAMAGSGDPALQAGAHYAMQAPFEQERINASRLEQARERQKMAQEGPQPELGGQTPSVYEMLTKRKAASQIGINPITGQPYQKTGPGPAPAPAPSPNAPLTYDKRLAPMQKAFAQDFDQNIGRAGLPKENQARINAGDRILAIAVNKDPVTGEETPKDLPPAQMTDLATAAAALLSNGGGDAGTRHEMTPYTKGRTWAEIGQWLSDAPQGTGQQAFVKLLVDMAHREQGVAQSQIHAAQQQRLANHLMYFSQFPDQAKAQMQAYGWDPSEVDMRTGKYTPKMTPPAASGSGSGEQIPEYKRINGKMTRVK